MTDDLRMHSPEAEQFLDPRYRLRDYRLPAAPYTAQSPWRPDPNPPYICPPGERIGRVMVLVAAIALAIEVIAHLRFSIG
jgi:hypothetical protein